MLIRMGDSPSEEEGNNETLKDTVRFECTIGNCDKLMALLLIILA